MSTSILLEKSWKELLLSEFSAPYMLKLKAFLLQQKQQQNKVIYPKGPEIFNAFSFTPITQVKVVLVGQDPYHGANQAHGLCFSVPHKIKPPPSLLNIYKELKNDLNITPAKHGCLIKWAKQGVLLLNSILTVEQGLAGSHQNKGWEMFTDKVIQILNNYNNRLIFLLWGAYAANKCNAIDTNKHFVLKAAHPSPFSANKGFFGCKHFSKTNQILQQLGKEPIDWDLNDKTYMV